MIKINIQSVNAHPLPREMRLPLTRQSIPNAFLNRKIQHYYE